MKTDSEKAFLLIELSILFQRSLEIMDELKIVDDRFGNIKLKNLLKSTIKPLEKQCDNYNELFKVDQKTMLHFYDVVRRNSNYMMQYDLLDQAKICSYLLACEKNQKSIDGIITKILKD